MTKRKIFLLTADAVLLIVLILQLCLGARKTVKDFILKDTPDEIVLQTPDGEIPVDMTGEVWTVGEKKYAASKTALDSLVSGITSFKALNKVASANNNENLEKYELVDGKKITVIAKKEGKILRTLEIGKEATAGSQCYALVDGGKDIYLLAGNVRNTFDKTIDKLRSNAVLDLDKTLIHSVRITSLNGADWTLSRTGSGDDTVYSITGADGIELDNTKASSFLEGFDALMASKWVDEGTELNGIKLLTAEIGYDARTITLDLYVIPASSQDDVDLYYGKCSETPYTFTIANYTAKKFSTQPEELAK